MSTGYVGLFCPDKHFNVVRTYAIADLHARVFVDWVVRGQAQCRCRQCGKVFSFLQSDIAYSNFPDGRDAWYPQRPAAASRA